MKISKKSKQKGFTLIELLIVIAIIAILSVVVVLTLNPAEMLRRSRDSNRVSDLSIMKTAICLYLADVIDDIYGSLTITCYIQLHRDCADQWFFEFASATINSGKFRPPGISLCHDYGVHSSVSMLQPFVFGHTSSRSFSECNGTGWIPINLSLVSSGAPIGQWPADPAYSAGTNCGRKKREMRAFFYSHIPVVCSTTR